MDMSKLDVTSTFEQSSVQLRQLSDQVTRIATTLARLSNETAADAKPHRERPANGIPKLEVAVETVRDAIRARQLRNQFFDNELFADPAWDMLLDLFEAELAQLRVTISSLSVAAAVPATTALRWIATMTDAGLFKRRADPNDGRRVFVELSPEASGAMRRYFNQLGKPLSV
jgi:DNA-binding MarR family transcriptional regulator